MSSIVELQSFIFFSSLQELHVPSIGARWEFAAKLAQCMSSNPLCSLVKPFTNFTAELILLIMSQNPDSLDKRTNLALVPTFFQLELRNQNSAFKPTYFF